MMNGFALSTAGICDGGDVCRRIECLRFETLTLARECMHWCWEGSQVRSKGYRPATKRKRMTPMAHTSAACTGNNVNLKAPVKDVDHAAMRMLFCASLGSSWQRLYNLAAQQSLCASSFVPKAGSWRAIYPSIIGFLAG